MISTVLGQSRFPRIDLERARRIATVAVRFQNINGRSQGKRLGGKAASPSR